MARRANGEGTIKKRQFTNAKGKRYYRWFARVTVSWDGHKKRSKDGPLRASQDEAKADLRELQAKLSKGLLNVQSNQRLSEYADTWLDQVKRTNKFRTWQTYESDMRKHVLPHLGHKRIDKLKRTDVQGMINTVHQAALENGQKGAAVARKARAALRTALQAAVDLELIDRNPCEGVKVPPETVNVPDLWTPDEARIFLEAAKSSDIYALIVTALTSGLREGELLALRWADLETYLEAGRLAGELHVRNTQVFVPKTQVDVARAHPTMRHLYGRFFLDDPKTPKSKASVPIPTDTVETLLIHRFEQQLEASTSSRWQDLGLIFPARYGLPMNQRTLHQKYHRIIEASGVPRITWHDLRDTHATYLLMQGVDIGAVSERLRHSTKSTTLNRYVHVVQKLKRRSALDLDSMFAGGSAGGTTKK